MCVSQLSPAAITSLASADRLGDGGCIEGEKGHNGVSGAVGKAVGGGWRMVQSRSRRFIQKPLDKGTIGGTGRTAGSHARPTEVG